MNWSDEPRTWREMNATPYASICTTCDRNLRRKIEESKQHILTKLELEYLMLKALCTYKQCTIRLCMYRK